MGNTVTVLKQPQKEKPRQGPNLDKTFGSNIHDIISNMYNIDIISPMTTNVNCFWQI